MGTIIHGNKNFGFAPIVNNEGTYSFGTPVMMPGLVSATIEVEQEDNTIYADDKAFCVVKGAKVRTATVNLRNIPNSYLSYLGFKEAENGGFSDTGIFPTHAIFFQTQEDDCETGTSAPTLHYVYAVKASEPTQESETDEENVEAAELEISYSASDSAFVVDADNIAVQYFKITRTSENASLFDTYQSAVILPTSPIPSGE